MTNPKQNTENQPVHPAVNDMTPAARDSYGEIKKLYDQAARSDLLKRHAIGTIVAQMTLDERKYGQNVISLLANALGVGEDYLYRSRKVTLIFDPDEIQKLGNRQNRFGRRIEFTHLWLISNMPMSKTRELLMAEFFRKGLTTRELEQRIKGLIAKSKPSQPGRPKSPPAGLAAMRKVASDFNEKRRIWQEAVFEPIEDATANGSEISYLDDLVETKQLHEELRRQVDANIEDLEKCIRCAEAARSAVQKAKRHPKVTTPSRPRVNVKKAKVKASVGRRRVVE